MNEPQYLILMPLPDGAWQTHDGVRIQPMRKSVAANVLELLAQDEECRNSPPLYLVPIPPGQPIQARDFQGILEAGGLSILDANSVRFEK